MDIQSLLHHYSSRKTADVSKHTVVCANTTSTCLQPPWQMLIWFRLEMPRCMHRRSAEETQVLFSCQRALEPWGPPADWSTSRATVRGEGNNSKGSAFLPKQPKTRSCGGQQTPDMTGTIIVVRLLKYGPQVLFLGFGHENLSLL